MGEPATITHNVKYIDIANTPELARLAEEVRQTQEPRMLRRGSQDVALVLPISSARPTAQSIWAGYDPDRVRAALEASAGALAGVDLQNLLADIQAEREQASAGRPS